MHQPRILHQVKLSFEIEGQIMNFSDKQKLKELFIVDLPCKKYWKKFFSKKKNDIGKSLLKTTIAAMYSVIISYG